MSKDLLNDLGKKAAAAEGSGKTSEAKSQSIADLVQTQEGQMSRGTDLLGTIDSKRRGASANTATETPNSSAAASADPKSTSGAVEPTGAQDPNDTWSTESALKEVKKLREENKAYRLKYAEQLDKVKAEKDAQLQQREEEVKALLEAKTELDRIKAEQEDKKRDLSEKVAFREARIAELQAQMDARDKNFKSELDKMSTLVKQYEADKAAENQVYQTRLDEELAKIPENYKDYANLIVKGAGDPRDALTILIEAKIKGMFDEKTVIVNHSTPGANDGARMSRDKIEKMEEEERNRLSSSQKIGMALKGIRSGNPNSAFRTK